VLILRIAGLEEAKKPSGEMSSAVIQTRLATLSLPKISPARQAPIDASASHRFKFGKSGQLFTRVHNEMLTVGRDVRRHEHNGEFKEW
jgi:hypothetical protein